MSTPASPTPSAQDATRRPSGSAGSSAAQREPVDIEFFICLVLLVVAMTLCLGRLRHAKVNGDELEHLHSAWLWAQGLVPYAGFNEHHPPLFWLLLRPVVAGSGTSLAQAVMSARWIMFGVCCGSWAATAWLVLVWTGSRRSALYASTGWALACVLCGHTLYVRPDLLVLLLLLLGTAACLRGFFPREGRRGAPAWLWALGGGVCLALSGFVLQKAIFWVGAFAPVLAGLALLAPRARRVSLRLPLLGFLVGGLLVAAVAVTWIQFAVGWSTWWDCIVGTNLRMAESVSDSEQARWGVVDPLFRAMPFLPFALLAAVPLMRHWRPRSLLLLAACLVGACGLVLAAPAVRTNYYFPLFWLLVFIQAEGLRLLVEQQPVRLGTLARVLVLVPVFVSLPSHLPQRADRVLSELERSVAAYQLVLDRLQPGDTIVSMEHWNPVFVMDADPALWMVRMSGHARLQEPFLMRVIETQQPRFVTRTRRLELEVVTDDYEANYGALNAVMMERLDTLRADPPREWHEKMDRLRKKRRPHRENAARGAPPGGAPHQQPPAGGR